MILQHGISYTEWSLFLVLMSLSFNFLNYNIEIVTCKVFFRTETHIKSLTLYLAHNNFAISIFISSYSYAYQLSTMNPDERPSL